MRTLLYAGFLYKVPEVLDCIGSHTRGSDMSTLQFPANPAHSDAEIGGRRPASSSRARQTQGVPAASRLANVQ